MYCATVHRMEHDETLWLAGLLEGEGSFYTYGQGQTIGTRPCACVQVHMTDKDVIERAAAIMGAKSVLVRRTKKPAHWKETWQARVAGAKAETVMRTILPHMGQRRTEKIASILALELSHH